MQGRLALEKEALGTASPAFPIRKEKKGQTKSRGSRRKRPEKGLATPKLGKE